MIICAVHSSSTVSPLQPYPLAHPLFALRILVMDLEKETNEINNHWKPTGLSLI